MTFTHQKGDTYHVTGLLYNSDKRFKITTDNPHYALGINLWNGTVWQVRNNKRKLIKRVTN